MSDASLMIPIRSSSGRPRESAAKPARRRVVTLLRAFACLLVIVASGAGGAWAADTQPSVAPTVSDTLPGEVARTEGRGADSDVGTVPDAAAPAVVLEEAEPLPGTPVVEGAEPASGDKPEQEGASTLELLNEDDRLEAGAAEGPEPSADEPAGTADGTEPTTDAAEGTAGVEEADAATDAAAVSGLNGPEAEESPEADTGNPFPTSPGIEQQKAFWIKIFTHYHSQQGVLHDGRIALPVYEDLDLEGLSYRAQRRYIREHKRALAGNLRALAVALESGATLDAEQQALRERLPTGSTPQDIRDFAANVRFQRGLADRFKAGLVRSGALEPHIKAALARHGVPEDLMYLPHVESSFYNNTRSKAGAMGIWQFTRGTGRMFMRVGYELDERLDPVIASEAAAKFLRQNYERLGTWPLAITAYNHGPQSLERIVRRMGTRNLGVLIEGYNGRLFKFASKNFYAEFLAAREVAQQSERYFGALELAPPLEFKEVELPWYLSAEEAAAALDVNLRQLEELNPALKDMVWSGAKYMPPGYRLRIPPDRDPGRFVAAVPEDSRHDKQKRSVYVRVARGDTLYSIGRRHGISWRSIALANNISSYRRLRAGQKLILPWDGANPPPSVAKVEDDRRDAATAGAALDDERVVARIPVVRSAPWQGGMPDSDSEDILADQFQELRIVRVNAARKEGDIVAAYGETVGKYAEWAGITASEFRRLNGMSYRSVLRPGQHYTVPLDAVNAEQFEARRMDFHRQREQSFFAEYQITEKVKIEVRRGHSPWNIAQANNVPMWLFYKENPKLLTEPLRVGMEVILPVLHAGAAASR